MFGVAAASQASQSSQETTPGLLLVALVTYVGGAYAYDIFHLQSLHTRRLERERFGDAYTSIACQSLYRAWTQSCRRLCERLLLHFHSPYLFSPVIDR